jgi:homoserine kinase type II
MSVYTHVTADEVQALLAQHLLSPLRALTPIKGGIENSNYFIALIDGSEWVLTLFEELSAAQAAFIGPLLTQLAHANIPVAAPLHTASGEWLHTLAGKPAQLAPRMKGIHPKHPDALQCHAMGRTLAGLHQALQNYPLQRQNVHGADWWNDLAQHWCSHLSTEDNALLTQTLQLHEETCANFSDLPQGLIHGDLFRDNCLFQENTITAVLDFSETSRDYWLLDMAISINDFCRDWPTDRPDAQRRQAFIAGYTEIRSLTDNETQALPVFLATAAMRFWLSRLDIAARNQGEGRGGELVLEKNPAEMRELTKLLLNAALKLQP